MNDTSGMSATRFPLDATTLQRLDTLALVSRRALASGRAGMRRSPLAGSSMEFSDYRRYSPGDDFRHIDWRAYARLERLFLRLFEAEENLTVTVLIDCSDSMQHGDKAALATKLVAALAYIALKSEDSVLVGALTDRLSAYRRAGSGSHAIWTVGDFLAQLPQAGATDLNRALSDLGRIMSGPGLTVVISDFLSPGGYQAGLRSLASMRQEVALVQILAPDEIEPEIQGDWRLRDSEGSGSIDVSITPAVLEAYRRRLDDYMKEIAAFAHANAMTYAMVPSDTALLDVAQRLLRQVGVVK
jgi:uncharacterized protein (DUF58 family)